MDRRDFLKILGIGGVALTLPKPLGIIAAKMADLQAPPLHVGRATIGPMSDAGKTFMIHNIGVAADGHMVLSRWTDFYEHWKLSIFQKNPDDPSSRVKLLQMPAGLMPDPQRAMVDSEVEPYYVLPRTYICAPGAVMEFWWTPADPANLPEYPLPPLKAVLRGVMVYRNEKPMTGLEYVRDNYMRQYFIYAQAETLQLDRARAIEMGLVSATEPEGIIT